MHLCISITRAVIVDWEIFAVKRLSSVHGATKIKRAKN